MFLIRTPTLEWFQAVPLNDLTLPLLLFAFTGTCSAADVIIVLYETADSSISITEYVTICFHP
jgi:hypothetical protein